MPRQLDPDKRRAIMRAAEQLLLSRRYHEVTTDEIAQLAGVGKGTIYRHFADKDALFRATMDAGFDELCALVEQQAAAGSPLRQRLLDACQAIAEFFEHRRPWFALLQSEEPRLNACSGERRAHFRARRRRLVTALAPLLAGERLRGELRGEQLASLLLGMLRTYARDLRREDGELSVAVVLDCFLHGALAEAERVR